MQTVSPQFRWALTPPFHLFPVMPGSFFSVALSVALLLLAVSQPPALWSPDFPLTIISATGCAAFQYSKNRYNFTQILYIGKGLKCTDS